MTTSELERGCMGVGRLVAIGQCDKKWVREGCMGVL